MLLLIYTQRVPSTPVVTPDYGMPRRMRRNEEEEAIAFIMMIAAIENDGEEL